MAPAQGAPAGSFPVDLGSTQAEIDSAIKVREDSTERESSVRRRQVRVLPTRDSIWLEAHRTLDLTGDGRADELVLVATGPQGDQLDISLAVHVDGTVVPLATWESGWELKDPPFGLDAPQATVDSFIRDRLLHVLAEVTTSSARVSETDFEAVATGCDGERVHCLAKAWRVSEAEAAAAMEELRAGAVPGVDLSYGYETVLSFAWIRTAKRFVEVFGCC